MSHFADVKSVYSVLDDEDGLLWARLLLNFIAKVTFRLSESAMTTGLLNAIHHDAPSCRENLVIRLVLARLRDPMLTKAVAEQLEIQNVVRKRSGAELCGAVAEILGNEAILKIESKASVRDRLLRISDGFNDKHSVSYGLHAAAEWTRSLATWFQRNTLDDFKKSFNEQADIDQKAAFLAEEVGLVGQDYDIPLALIILETVDHIINGTTNAGIDSSRTKLPLLSRSLDTTLEALGIDRSESDSAVQLCGILQDWAVTLVPDLEGVEERLNEPNAEDWSWIVYQTFIRE